MQKDKNVKRANKNFQIRKHIDAKKDRKYNFKKSCTKKTEMPKKN